MTGHAGFEKPQDCSVTVTLLDAGGVEIRLQSRQAVSYTHLTLPTTERV